MSLRPACWSTVLPVGAHEWSVSVSFLPGKSDVCVCDLAFCQTSAFLHIGIATASRIYQIRHRGAQWTPTSWTDSDDHDKPGRSRRTHDGHHQAATIQTIPMDPNHPEADGARRSRQTMTDPDGPARSQRTATDPDDSDGPRRAPTIPGPGPTDPDRPCQTILSEPDGSRRTPMRRTPMDPDHSDGP